MLFQSQLQKSQPKGLSYFSCPKNFCNICIAICHHLPPTHTLYNFYVFKNIEGGERRRREKKKRDGGEKIRREKEERGGGESRRREGVRKRRKRGVGERRKREKEE